MSEYCKYCGRSYPDDRALLNNSCPLHPAGRGKHALFHGERRNDHHTTLAEKAAAKEAAKENE